MLGTMKTLVKLVAILALSGCSVYKSSFDCPAKKGIGCESVSTVNELINDERLEEYIAIKEARKKQKKSGCRNCDEQIRQAFEDKRAEEVIDSVKTVGAEKLRVHFNSYRGEEGILHKESEVEVDLR